MTEQLQMLVMKSVSRVILSATFGVIIMTVVAWPQYA